MIDRAKNLKRGDVFFLPYYKVKLTVLANYISCPYSILSVLTADNSHMTLDFNLDHLIPIIGQSTEVSR